MTGSRQSATRLPRVQPPLQRGAMVPRPWAGHPLRRWFRFLADPSIGGASDPLPAVSRRAPAPLRRLLLLVLVLTGALAGGQTMLDVLPQHGRTPLEGAIVLLFGILFAWISAGFWTAVMGAWVLTFGDRRSLSRALRDPALRDAPIPQEARTAVVMPICNEHVATVFAGLRATWESLQSTGQGAHFDFFVLSDSSDPDARADEMQAWTALNAELAQANGGEGPRIHYRWRALRTKRKAGNVADFCRRWGKGYRYMVVLDADSVMTGDSLTTLVRLMEAHPDAGIIQTAPKACGYDTLHARIQQFGSRVYAPLFTAGMHYWQLGESHYWGHNAILRVEPFMTHCALAPLPGRGSLSGEILSHDFVEAALMRRAGWKVWIAWDLDGSYEQLPPDLLTEVQRDRRWCQGNLQNSRLMFEPGLHPVHRAVFLTGTLSYLSAPLWLGFLLLSSALFMAQANTDPQYFLEPYQLFPIWPGAERNLVLALFGATAALLFAPKVLAILSAHPARTSRTLRRRGATGAGRAGRDAAFHRARTSAHDVPHPVRVRRTHRMADRLALASPRGHVHALVAGPASTWPARPVCCGVGGRAAQPGAGVSLVALAGTGRLAGRDPALGVDEPRRAWKVPGAAGHSQHAGRA